MALSEARDGAAVVTPMMIGVLPFGLAFGATTVAHGYGTPAAVGFSVIVFAGASQLAAVQALAGGGSALVAAAAAWTVNLRLLLYTASLAPYFSHERLGRRLVAAYVLTDQAYAASIARWKDAPDDRAGRFSFYMGGAMTLWIGWQLATLAGALIGNTIPKSVPLDFSIPLIFIALLMPTITSWPAAVAAASGGAAAVVSAELGAHSLSILVGAIVGITAGALAEGRITALRPEDA
jgi:4-azaleucine resistance transporter AzlC